MDSWYGNWKNRCRSPVVIQNLPSRKADVEIRSDVKEQNQDELEPIPYDDKDEHLDPPMGTGLRFDEIEEMIDEVLSLDDS